MAVAVTHIDDTPMCVGTHKGGNGTLTLRDPGADFKSTGIDPDLSQAIYNETDGSNGTVTAVTENEVVCTLSGGTNNTWSKDDEYSIYITGTKDATISTHYTDRLFGRKVVNKNELIKGRFPEDVDIPEKQWGPGFPEPVS